MIVNPGIRRFLGSAIQRLFNSASVSLPLTHTAIPTRGDITPSFTRATTSTWPNNDGYLVTGVAGEIGFVGARRHYNKIPTTSENFDNAAWTKTAGGGGSIPVVTADQEANPIPGLNVAFADKVVFVAPVSGDISQLVSPVITGVVGNKHQAAFYVKAFAAGDVGKVLLFRHAAASGYTTITLTDSYQQVSNSEIVSGTSTTLEIVNRPQFGSTAGTISILLAAAQVYDITAETDQTTIRPYVSVGALDYRSDRDPLYLSLPGTAGHYASTPDSVANSITGDIDIRFYGALSDLTPASFYALAAKYQGAGTRSYIFYLAADGKIHLLWSANGTATAGDVQSTVTVGSAGFSDGNTVGIRVTFDVDNGSAGNTATFYTSANGTTWAQLGDPVVTAGVTSFFDGTAVVEFGGSILGTNLPLNGRIYSIQIYNTIGGTTPVLDFNPHRDAVTPTGTITSSTTGEVWTINGASSVVRNAAYHGSMVDGVKCFPTDLDGNALTTMTTPLIELAGTNLCLQSNAFTTTWLVTGTPAATQNVVGPDGATSAWTLTDNDAAASELISQDIVLTAAAYTFSVFVKKTTGVQTAYPLLLVVTGTTWAICTIDTTNGVATNWTAISGGTILAGTSARIRSYNDSFWRVELTYTATAATYSHYIAPAATTNPTQSSGSADATAQGSAVIYGAQVELGTAATSYIATTTVAATRNADQLYYTGADIANIKTLAAIGFKRESGVSVGGYVCALSDNTTNEFAASYLNTATQHRFNGHDGGVNQWETISSNAYTPGQLSSIAWSMATNDVKFSKDGVAQTQDTGATMPTVTRLEYGMLAGIYQLNGYPGTVYGWNRNLSQSELNAITA